LLTILIHVTPLSFSYSGKENDEQADNLLQQQITNMMTAHGQAFQGNAPKAWSLASRDTEELCHVWGDSLPRLRDIKARHDPLNVFARSFSVAGSNSASSTEAHGEVHL
jgi:hypothetical protein